MVAQRRHQGAGVEELVVAEGTRPAARPAQRVADRAERVEDATGQQQHQRGQPAAGEQLG